MRPIMNDSPGGDPTLLLFSVVVSTTAGWVAACVSAVGFVVLWYVVPRAARGPEPGTER